MNAYSNFMDMSMTKRPDPLTTVDQSSFPWFKFANVEFLLNPKISALTPEAKGVLINLMAYAGREKPFASLPADPVQLVTMGGFKLPPPYSKAHEKAFLRAEAIVNTALEAAFVQCNDLRYYCPLMINELSAQPIKDTAGQADYAGTHQAADADHKTKAQRQKEYRERLKLREQQELEEQLRKEQERNESDQALHAQHNENVTRYVPYNGGVMRNVTRYAQNVTFEGGKGGELDPDLERDLEKSKEKQQVKSTSANAQILEDKFAQFWKAYPNKKDRKRARDKFLRIKPNDAQFTEIMTALHAQVKYWNDSNTSLSHIPHPTTWLNGERWNDEITPVQAKTAVHPDDKTYYGISKDDVQKYARAGETEHDCAKRLFEERKQAKANPSPAAEQKPLPATSVVWSMGHKHTLKQIQQLDSSITPERIDAMAKEQGTDRDAVLATLFKTLALQKQEQDIAATRAKAGAA